jgi:glycosyl transferase family 25
MKCLVLNVASATERMEFMVQQLSCLGLNYERIDAVTPVVAAAEGSKRYWSTWERPLKSVEKACLLTHVKAWKRVLEENLPMLILEDDALLSAKTRTLLDAAARQKSIDHLSLEVRGRKKIVSKFKINVTEDTHILRLYQDRSGAAAYVLWPSGAKKLLERQAKQTGLADALICKSYELRSYQTEPACAAQLDQVITYGITCDFETQSSIGMGRQAVESKHTITFRTRRVLAQLRMTLRAVSCLGRGTRRNILLNKCDFQHENQRCK